MPYIWMMKRLIPIALIPVMLAAPAHADPKDWEGFRKDLEQFSEDSRKFLQSWVNDLGPLLDALKDKIDDISNYDPPEVLPNGDIIIRRKPVKKPKNPPKPPVEI